MRTKIISVLLLNAITFILARIWWGFHGGLAATLETHIGDTEDTTMTYFIAGNLNQADTAFDFMKSEFGSNYTFVQFSTKGWNAKATAKLVEKDIREHGYHARIFTMSLGDHVARYLEHGPCEDLEIYAVNPCPNRKALAPPLDTVLCFAAPVAEVVCHALGWISYLPIVPSWGGTYSPILLIDQYWCIYYDYPPMDTDQTRGVIYSMGDELLENRVVEPMYPNADIRYINAGHSDIVNSATKEYNAIRKLLKKE